MIEYGKAKAEIANEKTLSDQWTRLTSFEIDYTDSRGEKHRLKREIYHRTPAACILLYDPKRETVVLVRQFRLPAQLVGEPAWMIEVPAGLLDGEEPEAAIRREAMEETGFRIRDVRFLFKAMTSPGSVTEIIHCFAALIDTSDRVADGGGLAEEHEDIEVMEVRLSDAMAMIERGEIYDAKTIMLMQWAVLNAASWK
ncbi:NUDIX domain-containing protein [Rhizobium sp. P38BS-XIX]|uniref:NUDIX domain-containing protein n=1 Tax=Rhizobium sp. P38BS-XIX TaxID=2726740 RepID=UPI0014576B37|nr:NUDIX domain-containing protein [Rhizobium sp. P38BS-XIX]NLR95604.1 NUDIX domain-containing protein [Rhizobium sp. P38BS-XIX]